MHSLDFTVYLHSRLCGNPTTILSSGRDTKKQFYIPVVTYLKKTPTTLLVICFTADVYVRYISI